MDLTRIIDAFLSPISWQDWYVSLGVLLSYGLIVLPIGFKTGFLQWKLTEFLAWKFWQLLQLFIMPALVEESIFRVILLPHPLKTINNIKWLLWAIFSLVLFIIYHPLNAKFFYSPGRGLFSKPIFLFFAGLLGIACTISYKITGSIWSSVIIHWLIVVIWLFLLGGEEKLKVNSSLNQDSIAVQIKIRTLP